MMIARGMMMAAALGLAGCATGSARSFDDPTVQQMFTMATPSYFANISLANQIAQSCPRYRYDAALDAELNVARNEVGRGSLAAASLRNAIELETDISRRGFSVKHGVDLAVDDLCSAGDAEVLEGSPLSALLIPA